MHAWSSAKSGPYSIIDTSMAVLPRHYEHRFTGRWRNHWPKANDDSIASVEMDRVMSCFAISSCFHGSIRRRNAVVGRVRSAINSARSVQLSSSRLTTRQASTFRVTIFWSRAELLARHIVDRHRVMGIFSWKLINSTQASFATPFIHFDHWIKYEIQSIDINSGIYFHWNSLGLLRLLLW